MLMQKRTLEDNNGPGLTAVILFLILTLGFANFKPRARYDAFAYLFNLLVGSDDVTGG